MSNHFQQWSQLAPRGLLLIGAGMSIIGWATMNRVNRQGFWAWVLPGTFGLAVLNFGISVFGEAVKHRTMYEMKSDLDE